MLSDKFKAKLAASHPLERCAPSITWPSTLLVYSLLLTTCCATDLHAQWKKIAQTALPSTCIYFMPGSCTPKVGFAGTQGWMIYRTSNGGTTWTKVKSVPSGQYYVSNFTFKDSLNGWCSLNEIGGGVSLTNAVYRTTDAGLTWNPLNISGDFPSIYYNAVSKRLMLTSWDQPNKYSTNDGISWQDIAPQQHCGFSFTNAANGIMSAVTNHPWYVTNDAGVTWRPTTFQIESYQPLSVPCSSVYYAAAEALSNVYTSTDLGSSWQLVAPLSPIRLTGDIVGDQQHLFIQTTNDVMVSVDQGKTWSSLGGPLHTVDFRMTTLNGYLYASDPTGALWKYRYDSTRDQLQLSTDTIRVGNNECTTLLLTAIIHCRECVDSIRIRNVSVTGSPNFTLQSVPTLPKGIAGTDSVVVYRFSALTEHDTAQLHITYSDLDNVTDTIISLIGSGTAREALSLDRDTLLFQATGCPDVMHSLHIISPPVLSCADSLQITSLQLRGASNFQIVGQRSLPWSLSSLDSIQLIRTGDTVAMDSATLLVKFTQHGYTFDTTIYLFGQGIIRKAAQITASFDDGSRAKSVKAGDHVTAVLRLRDAVSKTSLLNTISLKVWFGGRISSEATVTPVNGWSIVSENRFVDHSDFVLSHAPYDAPAGEEILHCAYRLSIGDTTHENIWLTDIHYNPSDPDFEKCILLALLPVDTLALQMAPGSTCGDSLLTAYLRGEPLVRLLGINPNPASSAHSELTMTLRVAMSVKAKVSIYSMLGTLVFSEPIDLEKGQTKETLTIPSLPGGSYVIELSAPGTRVLKNWQLQ